MKKQRKIILLLVFTLLISSFPLTTIAKTRTYKYTAYYEVYKKGNIAYCCDFYNIFKVNLINQEVKQLTKTTYSGGLEAMRLYRNYIYYLENPLDYKDDYCLSRVSVDGNSYKRLTGMFANQEFAIKGEKIFYHRTHTSMNIMNLDGNNKRKSKHSFSLTKNIKRSNVKKYRTKTILSKDYEEDEGIGYWKTYLIKPNGEKIELATYYTKDLACEAECENCGYIWECKIWEFLELQDVCPNCHEENSIYKKWTE